MRLLDGGSNARFELIMYDDTVHRFMVADASKSTEWLHKLRSLVRDHHQKSKAALGAATALGDEQKFVGTSHVVRGVGKIGKRVVRAGAVVGAAAGGFYEADNDDATPRLEAPHLSRRVKKRHKQLVRELGAASMREDSDDRRSPRLQTTPAKAAAMQASAGGNGGSSADQASAADADAKREILRLAFEGGFTTAASLDLSRNGEWLLLFTRTNDNRQTPGSRRHRSLWQALGEAIGASDDTEPVEQTVGIVCDVRLQRGYRMVTARSTLRIQNDTNSALAVLTDDDVPLSTSAVGVGGDSGLHAAAWHPSGRAPSWMRRRQRTCLSLMLAHNVRAHSASPCSVARRRRGN